MNDIRLMPLVKILPNPWQTRVMTPDPEYIKSLALDIAKNGLLQTPMGREVDDGVQLAFGHNRLAAFRWLVDVGPSSNIEGDYSTMPVKLASLTDEQMAELAWAENEQRRDVTPIERALAIRQRMESFGWNQTECAEHLGLNRSTVSNILRLLNLPEDLQDPLAKGLISERAATALLPMYELPEYVLEAANNDYWGGPKTIVDQALRGLLSDDIRRLVKNLTERYTRPLQGAVFGLDELFPEGKVLGYDHDGKAEVYCGLCRTCDRRLKDNGNICLDKRCYTAKTAIWERNYLAKAASKSGIQAVDPNKGGVVTTISEGMADRVLATKCENLRLVYSANPGRNVRSVDNFPKAVIVCDKRNNSCSCLKGFEITARAERSIQDLEEEVYPENGPDDDPIQDESVGAPTPTARQLEEAARQARKDKRDVAGAHAELVDDLTEKVVEWLRDDLPGAFFVLVENYSWARPDDLDIERIYRSAAKAIVRRIVGHSDYVNIVEMYKVVNMKLETLRLPQVTREKPLVEVFGKDGNDGEY